MKIRAYQSKDADAVIRLIAQEVPHLPHYRHVIIDESWLRAQLMAIDGRIMQAWVLVDADDIPHGGIAGYCVPMIVSPQRMAGDLLLFIEQGYRSLRAARDLIETFRAWAINDCGAAIVYGTVTGGYRTDTIDEMLKRMGYANIGSVYDLRSSTKERQHEPAKHTA